MGDLHIGLAVEAAMVALVAASVAIASALSQRRLWPPHPHGLLSAVGIGVVAVLWQRELLGGGRALGLVLAIGLLLVVARSATSPLVPPLAAISLVGVWAAVPDTETALVAAVGAIVAFAVGLLTGARSPWGDRIVAVGSVVVTAVIGSAGRSEVIGGLACAGLLVVPLPRRRRAWSASVLIGSHSVIVVLASRIVTRLDRPFAMVAAGALLGAALAVAASGRSGAGGTPGHTEPA